MSIDDVFAKPISFDDLLQYKALAQLPSDALQAFLDFADAKRRSTAR
jgi:hypothetical protein